MLEEQFVQTREATDSRAIDNDWSVPGQVSPVPPSTSGYVIVSSFDTRANRTGKDLRTQSASQQREQVSLNLFEMGA